MFKCCVHVFGQRTLYELLTLLEVDLILLLPNFEPKLLFTNCLPAKIFSTEP